MRSLFRLFTQQPLAAKVPEITVMFWVVKILTTASGEAISDYLSTGNKAVGALIEIVVFVVALDRAVQHPALLRPRLLAVGVGHCDCGDGRVRHHAPDLRHPVCRHLTLLGRCPGLVFFLWDRSEHTLSIHSITTSRREKFYWATIFATFALGTAVGDFTAQTLGLGYLASAFFFCVVILIPWAGWARFRMNEILAFWFAYVGRRDPSEPRSPTTSASRKDLSGLGFGDLKTAAVITLLVVIGVAYTAIARFDIQPPQSETGMEVAGGT